MSKSKPEEVHVWDLLVRTFHWLLVAGFAVAFVTEDDTLDLHVWAGYLVGALVVLRLAWGFIGPRPARFADFITSPGAALRYLGDLLGFRAKRYLGHSPAGGAMVVLLFASLAVTVVTGLAVYGAEEKAGPLAPMFATAPGDPLAPQRGIDAPADELAARYEEDDDEHEDEDGDDNGENGEENEEFEALEELHELAANFTLFLIFLHVGGVLLASVVHRENLVLAMFTGRKRKQARPDGPAPGGAQPRSTP